MGVEQKPGIGAVGLGRIGQELIRQSLLPDVSAEVRAVVSRQPAAAYLPLLEFDSKFPGDVQNVRLEDDGFSIGPDGYKIKFLQCQPGEPGIFSNLWSWSDLEIPVVIETSGRGKKTPVENFAAIHINHGARAVIISCPTKDNIPHYVVGVNHSEWNSEHKIISATSCTTNAISPILKVMLDNFGNYVDTISALTVHTLTRSNDHNLDDTNANPRIGRSACRNIIPTKTGAAKAVEKVLPQLAELQIPFSMRAVRVPVADVSYLDVSIAFRTSQSVRRKDVLEVLQQASEEEMKGIISIGPENSVSSMFAGNRNSIILCPEDICVTDERIVTLVGFYDNESGYAARCIDLAAHISQSA